MRKQRYDAEYKAAYYQAHKEKYAAISKAKYLSDPIAWKLGVRKRRLRTKYFPHLSIEEAYSAYLNLFAIQNGLCAICKNPETKKDPQAGTVCWLAVDHCHDTGTVRGLLCFRCNTNLSWFEKMGKSYANYLSKGTFGG